MSPKRDILLVLWANEEHPFNFLLPQRGPEYPCAQEQKYPPDSSTLHDPPLSHGADEQM